MTPALLKAAIEAGSIKTRAAAGREYALIVAVCNQRRDAGGDPDIAALNGAIVKRWSRSGLDWIKRRGWAIWEAGGELV